MRKERYNVKKIGVGTQRKNDVAMLRKNPSAPQGETKGADLRGFDTESLGF